MHKILVPFVFVTFQMAGVLFLQPAAHAGTPAPQTLNPYSESILKTILSSCRSDASTLNLGIPLSRQVGQTAQQILDESFAQMQKQSKQSETVLESLVQQRLAQLKIQIQDKKKLAFELQQIEAVISSGKVNGQSIDPEQLDRLKQSRDDLKKLSDDPNYLKVMAKRASDTELAPIRSELEAAKRKMDSCSCVSTTLQKQYTEQEFLRRSLEELQSGPAISKDWQSALQTCKAPTSK